LLFEPVYRFPAYSEPADSRASTAIQPVNSRVISLKRRGTRMGNEKIMQYECKVCGRKIDVTRTGDIYEEPVFCCGLETTEIGEPFALEAPAVKKKPAKKKPAKKKAAKKAVKKKAKKKAAKKAVKKAVKKKATKKKATKKKAKKKAAKKRR
jgi:outer membrane biosynthesis protein TonB